MPPVRRPRRVLLTLAWLPCALVFALWVRSYYWCDMCLVRGGPDQHLVMSELGGVYFLEDVTSDAGFFSAAAGVNGRLEEEMGTVRKWWLPFRMWRWGYGGRIYVMPHWVPTLVLAVPAVWLSRRRRRGQIPGLCPACGYDLRATPDR